MYLMDSILKTLPENFTEIISLHISDSFVHIFTSVRYFIYIKIEYFIMKNIFLNLLKKVLINIIAFF